ncbi:MAG: TetR family transcriptional regulator [Lachnospiraceae bacterium]|nr:TetR family transcriptional regulator [Lachnospiraceae bacterium]
MNPKFFDVKKEKQDAIINACLKVFAENGYKKASTDVIVKAAGISKGLLFHYFESKIGAYEFVYDYSVKYMTLELTQSVKRGETDFFEIQRMIEGVKTRVMRNYPYMQQFLDSVRFEDHPDALAVIGKDRNALSDTYRTLYGQADMSRFDDFVDVNRVIHMIGWMSEGFIRDRFREEPEPDLDGMNIEFSRYLLMLRNHLYRPGIKRATGFEALLEPGHGISVSGTQTSGNAVASRQTSAGAGEGRVASLSQLARQLNRTDKPDQQKSSQSQAPAKGMHGALLRQQEQQGQQKRELSFEERLARRDTSIFGVPIPPKKEKKPEEEGGKLKSDEKKTDEIKEKEEVQTDIKAAEPEKTTLTVSADEKAAPDKEAETAAKTEELTEAEGQTEAAEKQKKEPDFFIGREKEEPEETHDGETENASAEMTAEAKEIPEGSRDSASEKDKGDPDMIDLSALYSKRMEEAIEELGDTVSAMNQTEKGSAKEQEAPVQDPVLSEAEALVTAAGPEGTTVTEQGPAEQSDASGVYYGYPQADNSQGASLIFGTDASFYNVPPAFENPMYDPNMMYEDDSAAYAELYNSVNHYDVNGTTQEMPVNEVLAYRNAFASEYMKEETSKSSQPEKEEASTKKKKKKSFFSGLFGKNGKDESADEEDADNVTAETKAPETTGQPSDTGSAQRMPFIPQEPVMEDLNAMGPAPVLPEYDPAMAAQMGNYDPAAYYDIKY